MPKLRLGISIGDINGIGPEVVLKCFSDAKLYDLVLPIVFCHTSVLEYYSKLSGFPSAKLRLINSFAEAEEGLLNCMPPDVGVPSLTIGHSDKAAGEYSFESLKKCVDLAIDGNLDFITTAPINKDNIQSSSFQFPGHTEFLAKACGMDRSLMLMVHHDFRMSMLTGHIPLATVSEKVKKTALIDHLKYLSSNLENDFNLDNPRIAVLSLNPHAGDGGLLGSEENEEIIPAIKSAQEEGLNCEGPFPSDGFFGAQRHIEYDAVLAMYHDQGLIPFKAISFDRGVNFTAGLPIIRTSPDHGTAYDIAGKGIASEKSFKEAVELGIEIFHHRQAS